MSDHLPPCPECASDLTYDSAAFLACPMCGHEWVPAQSDGDPAVVDEPQVRDAVGNLLQDGDDVTVVRDLKFKGGVVKVGTKVRGIRLMEAAVDGHDIDAKVPGVGQMYLKSSVVKKG